MLLRVFSLVVPWTILDLVVATPGGGTDRSNIGELCGSFVAASVRVPNVHVLAHISDGLLYVYPNT